MSTVTFLGEDIPAVEVNGVHRSIATHRSFFSTLSIFYAGKLLFTELAALQQAGIDFLPWECTEAEFEEMTEQLSEEVKKKLNSFMEENDFFAKD